MVTDTSKEYVKGCGMAIIDLMQSADRHQICPHMAIEIASKCEAYNHMHEFLEYYGAHFGRIDHEPRQEQRTDARQRM